MKCFGKIFTTIIAVIGFCSSAEASAVPDSLLSERKILPLVVENPDSVLHLVDLAEARNLQSLPSYKRDQLRAFAYNELHMYSLVEMYAKRALLSLSADDKPTDVLKLLVSLSNSQYSNGKYQQCIESSMKAIQLARTLGNKTVELSVLGTMSQVSFSMGDRERGYDYLNQLIDMGIDSDQVRDLANVSWAMGLLNSELCAECNYTDAVAQSKRRLELIRRMDKLGPTPRGYIDQQYAYTYSRLAFIYQLVGNGRDAKKCYLAYNDTEFSKTLAGGIAICDYLLESKQYKEILEHTKPYYSSFAKDTITADYARILRLDAHAYSGLGDSATGYSLLERAYVIQDSLFAKQNLGKVQELATYFNINEKELQLEKSKVELQKRRIRFLIACGAGLLILLLLFIVLYYYQLLFRKYKNAALQIDKLLSERELQRVKVSLPNEVGGDDAVSEDAAEKKLLRVENVIMSEKLFLSVGNVKKEIADRCGITQVELLRLVQVEANLSLPEFLNKLRIDYSIMMMKKHPDWTIEAVAQESGFNNRGTYYQNFNKFYNMTPMQYRKAHEK